MILQERVYPLVRAAFSEEAGSDGDEPPMGPLCVYDSIFVRYDGDTAKAAGRLGASQPLVSKVSYSHWNACLTTDYESHFMPIVAPGWRNIFGQHCSQCTPR